MNGDVRFGDQDNSADTFRAELKEELAHNRCTDRPCGLQQCASHRVFAANGKFITIIVLKHEMKSPCWHRLWDKVCDIGHFPHLK
jgi:hypothetical protein